MTKSFLVALAASGGLFACGVAVEPPPPTPAATVHTTYRIIAGVSMGGIGSAALGFLRPERFDGIAPLGGPIDVAFFTRMIDQFLLGGFCTRQEIEAVMAIDPRKLNDPVVMDACAKKAVPGKWEHPNDFNHWHTTTNGGSFDRNAYVEMVTDLNLAYGNFLTENAASTFAPIGVDVGRVRNPPSDFCSNPVHVKGLRNAEYNPDGTYDAITFCDGEPALFYCRDTREKVDFCSDPTNKLTPLPLSRERGFADAFCASKGGAVQASSSVDPLFILDNWGRTDACRQTSLPVPPLLAWDFNGNGRRDYGEPLVNNSHERWDDVGADGCADAFEDGRGGCTATASGSPIDANKDNYDPDTNPNGTEQNWVYDPGEPYQDFGLDGVAGTHDFGEGNGSYDVNAGRRKLLAFDPRTNFRKLDAAGKKRIDVLVDGGIRDIFNFGLMSKHLFAAVKAARTIAVGQYRDFTEIPGMINRTTGTFDPWTPKWKSVPRDMSTLFGKENPTDQDRVAGEGDHVGNTAQAIERFETLLSWASWSWPSLARPVTAYGGSSLAERQRVEWFDSKSLEAKWEYAISLPPGYDDPANADKRYPVLFLLHGYGMQPSGFVGTSAITDAFVTDPGLKLRPIITVYPNGRCCWTKPTGERDCRNFDDQSHVITQAQGWSRECNAGTFWINRSGYTPDDGTAYGDAFFELMDHIDSTYRTLPAADVAAR